MLVRRADVAYQGVCNLMHTPFPPAHCPCTARTIGPRDHRGLSCQSLCTIWYSLLVSLETTWSGPFLSLYGIHFLYQTYMLLRTPSSLQGITGQHTCTWEGLQPSRQGSNEVRRREALWRRPYLQPPPLLPVWPPLGAESHLPAPHPPSFATPPEIATCCAGATPSWGRWTLGWGLQGNPGTVTQ